MDNPTFIDEENIPMIHQDEEDYNEQYDTLDTSRIDETSFSYPFLKKKQHQLFGFSKK